MSSSASRKLRIALAGFVVVVMLAPLTLVNLSTSEYNMNAPLTEKLPDSALGISVQSSSIDVNESLLSLVVTPIATGSYGERLPNGSYFALPLLLNLDVAQGPSSVQIPASQISGGIPVGVSLTGNSDGYPFDKYVGRLFASGLSQSASDDGSLPPFNLRDAGADIPGYSIQASAVSFLTGSQKRSDINDDRESGFSLQQWEVERSSATKFTAILLGILMVIGGVVSVLITSAIALGLRPPSINAMAWLAAFLFSIVQLRSQLPGEPPIGVAFDRVVFFPVIIALVLCIAVNLIAWIVRDDWDMENPVKAVRGRAHPVYATEAE